MKRYFIIFFAAFIMIQPIFADIVFVKDGAQIKGVILEEKTNLIIIKTEYGTLEINRNKIEKISYESKSNSEKEADLNNQNAKKLDSWYIGLSLGFGLSSNQNDLDSFQKSLYFNQSLYESKKKTMINLDLSLYFPIGQSVLLGAGYTYFLFSGSTECTVSGFQNISISSEFFHADLKYFLKEVNSGFFLSIAPGVGYFALKKEYNNQTNDYTSDLGFGIKGGIGYSVPLNSFGKAFMLSLEGFYLNSNYKNAANNSNLKFGILGTYFSLSWFW